MDIQYFVLYMTKEVNGTATKCRVYTVHERLKITVFCPIKIEIIHGRHRVVQIYTWAGSLYS